MFDFFRNNIKFLMGFLMLLIIPGFVMFGVDNYTRYKNNAEVVAKVGKTEITRQEWERATQMRLDQAQASTPGFDRAKMDTPAVRQMVLNGLVEERLWRIAAQDQHMLVSDQRLARELLSNPAMAQFRKADGTLDLERYKDALRSQGRGVAEAESAMRSEIASRQFTQGLLDSAFLPAGAAQPVLKAYFEQRELQLANFWPKDFRASVQVGDADVQAYYDANSAQFKTPEQADVEYVVLDLDAVARRTTLSESDLKAYYEQNNAKQAQNEQRRASHILLTVPAGAAADAKAQVKAKAEELLAELRKDPKRFAELAKARSQDPGSAAKGGDLDFFSRGAMVKPFEDAVFALQKGQISNLVESEFGFHIIQLTDVRAPKAEPFEAMRPKLEAELKHQQAQRRFGEAAEDFRNMVYEQSDTFATVADKLGLKVQTVKGLSRDGQAAGAVVQALANPRVLEPLFGEGSVQQKRNTEAVELAPYVLVSARVLAYHPAAVRPLTEVKDEVRERLVLQRATEKAKAEGAAKLAAWKAAPAEARLEAPVTVSRASAKNLAPSLVSAAFAAPVSGAAPAWVGVDLGDKGYAVLRVNRVLERVAPTPEQAKFETEQLARMWAMAETEAYSAATRSRYQVKWMTKANDDDKK